MRGIWVDKGTNLRVIAGLIVVIVLCRQRVTFGTLNIVSATANVSFNPGFAPIGPFVGGAGPGVPIAYNQTATNPIGSNDGGLSRSVANMMVGAPVAGDNFASFPFGATGLSDKGAPTATNPILSGQAGGPQAELSVQFTAFVAVQNNPTGLGTVQFAAFNVNGNVGTITNDYDQMTGSLTIGDSDQFIQAHNGFQPLVLTLPKLLDRSKGDVFTDGTISDSAELPSLPVADVISINGIIDLQVMDIGDDMGLNFDGVTAGIQIPDPACTSFAVLGAATMRRTRRRRGQAA
jgi:hypothetical protein